VTPPQPITPPPLATPPPTPAPRPIAPPPPGATPPPAPHAPFAPPAAAPAPAATLALRGTSRDFAAIALRDGVISREEIEAALSVAPPQAHEDSKALAAALVNARVLARVHADQIEACSIVERDAPTFDVPGYYLVEPLGFTAEGPVIRARRTTPDGVTREVALEILTPTLARDPALFEDFRKRTGALSAPEHPSLARTIDTGRAGDSYYLARELPPGETLAQRLRAKGPLSEKEAIALAFDIAGALAAYNTPGITHGSVRPENVVLAPGGKWVLRDIGSTPAPDVLDPDHPPPCADIPRYLSPEQIAGGTVDPRTDIYALGIVLFEAVTGAPPYDGASSAAVIGQHFAAEIPDPASLGVKLSPRFHGLLKVMTAKDAGQRYAHAEEMLDDLQGLREGTMAIDVDVAAGPGDKTQMHKAVTSSSGGHDRTMISSPEDDLDLKEMRKAAAERRAKEAAAKAAGEQPLTPVPPGGDPLIGHVLSGRYRLLQKLGAGGMGAVYKAEHQLLHKTIALKILHPKLLENEESVRRFDREVKAASRFSHPGITQIFDAGEDAGPQGKLHYMVMEYVEGTDLEKIINQQGALELPRVCTILKQVLAAVDEAHKKGIVHRDMKSDNIMICKDAAGTDVAKIMDFGIAKIVEGQDAGTATALHNQQSFKTRKGVVTGTPQYMSPEQAAGDPNIDHRSDLYSLGIILYEMCLGELPFKSNTAMGYLGKHIVEPPIPFKVARPDIELPKDLERIILKSLEKTREARYQTAGDMLQDLEKTVFPAVMGAGAAGTSKGGTGKMPQVAGGGGKKTAIIVLSIVLLAALGGGGFFGWRWWLGHRDTGFAESIRDATEAAAKGLDGLDDLKRILDEIGDDSKPAVKALRERQKALEAEKAKTEQRDDLLKKGDAAAAERSAKAFQAARGFYSDAKNLIDDELVEKKLAALAEKEKQFEAEALENQGNTELDKGESELALEKFEKALAKAPSDALEQKVQRTRYVVASSKAQQLASAPDRQKEAALHYREALRALGGREDWGEDRRGTQKKLEDLMSFVGGLTPTQRAAYAQDLLQEAHSMENELDFRAAAVCYRGAEKCADRDEDRQKVSAAAEAALKAADEQAMFEQARDKAHATLLDPLASTSDKQQAADLLQSYLDKWDGNDESGKPKGHFVAKAKEELAAVKEKMRRPK
jgi:serine/threonine protein kinase